MANNPRPAISGYLWDRDTLAAYNIHVQHQDSATFFGMDVDELPLPASLPDDDELLTELEAQDMEDLANKELINLLDLVMEGFEESYVDDFGAMLLRRLGYPEDGRVIHTRASNIRLEISGRSKYAQPNICIIDRSHHNCLLLVQENKRFRPGNQAVPQAQLIAEAIAAFTHNNHLLQHAGQETLDVHQLPWLVPLPTFYKICVTSDLKNGVDGGMYPLEATNVFAHAPLSHLPGDPIENYNEGMKPLENRDVILRCYEAFREFVVPESRARLFKFLHLEVRRHLRPLPPPSFRHLTLRRHFNRYRYRAVHCCLSLSLLSSRSHLSSLSHLSLPRSIITVTVSSWAIVGSDIDPSECTESGRQA
ncbi:hypothetical protein EDB89DRAFT_866818 [Lactarius sanguifluus]|nr:hypothetical protein EDB89DRAFT_866818 [Lactarius sanguifluus]